MTCKILAAIMILGAAFAQQPTPLPPGTASLPLDEYNRLVELASRPVRKADAPPAAHLLRNAHFNFAVTGDSVQGKLDLDGEIFARGERRIPLVSGLVVLDAKERGRELPIEHHADTHHALLTGPSEFAVSLEAGLPLSIEPGRAGFVLQVPACGAARLTLTVPGDQTSVQLSHGLITRRVPVPDGQRTTIEATLVPGQLTTISWIAGRAPEPAAVPRETRFLSDVKTLVSLTDSELTLTALAEVTVVQGAPERFEITIPEGFELTGVTGPTLDTIDIESNRAILRLKPDAPRQHQFLLSLARSSTGLNKMELVAPSVLSSGRESGELLIETSGPLELTLAERPGGLRRMDLREASPYLRSLARTNLQAAYRYQRKPNEDPILALDWLRYPARAIAPATASKAAVTTLVTPEGRSLTEVRLTVTNESQSFLKVALPPGATILSSEVAGEKVKPVQAADGDRVPLLRTGFRPTGPYQVSYVFQHAGTPFQKKGDSELTLPRMDIPVGLLAWEVFLPHQFKVNAFAGDAMHTAGIPSLSAETGALLYEDLRIESLAPGQIGGLVVDASSASIARASVTANHLETGITYNAVTNSKGMWLLPNVPSGNLEVTIHSPGFQRQVRRFTHDASRGSRLNVTLQVGAVTETVIVSSGQDESRDIERKAKQVQASAQSANVTSLQQRVAGVLPVAINIPRTGASYHFIRPLVVDQETKLTFRYRTAK